MTVGKAEETNNPNQDEEHEKQFDTDDSSERNIEIDFSEQNSKKEIDLDRDGVSFDSDDGSNKPKVNPAKPNEKKREILPKKLH